MSKKDSNDGTPIEFRVSENIDGRGARIPTPVNQPGWKYGDPSSRSKPSAYEWLFIGLTTILIAAFIFVVITTNSSVPQAWGLSLFCALFPTLWIVSATSRALYYSKEAKNNGNDKSSKKRKKKN